MLELLPAQICQITGARLPSMAKDVWSILIRMKIEYLQYDSLTGFS
jgi:hypothetical protein